MKRLMYAVIGVVLIVGAMVPATLRLAARADLDRYEIATLSAQDAGLVTFAFYDWGALNGATLRTTAVPWKLVEAALALRMSDGDVAKAAALTGAEIFRPFGFHVPDTIANWPDGVVAPVLDGPLGIVRATSGGFTPARVEIGNIGCAACHASVVYGADGAPDVTQVWLGGTNSSLNLDAYTAALFDGVLRFAETPELMQVVNARFPDMSMRERATLRFALVPALMSELQTRDEATGRLLPFVPSHIGATNGYDALRLQLGLMGQNDRVAQSFFTSIPALGGRFWRNRFLANGVYTAPGLDHSAVVTRADFTPARRDALADIVSYFLVPSMGVTAQVAIDQQPRARDVMNWIADYRPQPFPGAIDTAQAAIGRDIYAAECAVCHGTYDASLTRPALLVFPNWEGDDGTHKGPPLSVIEDISNAVNTSIYQPYLLARPHMMRSAPPLSGLWASAPYLANGSVPTLWHLMRPEERPQMFSIGGHHLDMDRVGIALSPPEHYLPWSEGDVYDSRTTGKSHQGHPNGFVGLSDREKDALLEYLKLL